MTKEKKQAGGKDAATAPLSGELEDLKREMRAASWVNWLESNRAFLMRSAIVLVIGILAVGLWTEHVKSHRESAATLYLQAVQAVETADKISLLEKVSKDFSDTTYAALAQMLLVGLDDAHAEQHLLALLDHPKADESWKWQARLELAGIYLEKKDADRARSLLAEPMGPAYEQWRQFLLARAASNDADRRQHLKLARQADQVDAQLSEKIDRWLAELGVETEGHRS